MEEPEPEEQFLRFARNGDLPGIQRLLMSTIREETHININCRGKRKTNLGWTPLHLACYFGHKDVVEELLKAGADVNLPNNVGDTPLHKAAFTGRKEVAMLLLHYDACATVINGTAQIPKDVTQNAEIRGMLEAAERTEERKLEEELLEAAREGDLSTLTQLLSRKKTPDINCTDLLGNTPLHSAAYRGQRQCALKLLKSGAGRNVENKKGQTALDLAGDTAMKLVLKGNAHRGTTRRVKKYEGLLWKSSRFFGWRSYWVVLQDGVLSWYSKQSDAAANVRRQGCKSLTHAQCLLRAKDSSFFTLKCFDDSMHHFKVSPKNDPEATAKEVAMLLLHYDACATVINGTAQIPKDVTQNAEIRGMLEAAERTEERKLEEELLEAAREGDLSTLTQLLSRKKTPDINCTDLLGNTPLHSAAYRGQRQCALKLLKSGAGRNVENKKGQTALDLAGDTAMKLVLKGNAHRGTTRRVKKYEGLLWKSSRFFGWRSYWVVLQDGVLSWYSKQSDAAANVRRQGCKSLTHAQCLLRAKDSSFFTLKCFDDSMHHFKVSPKNDPEATAKGWLGAVEEHSAYSTHYCSHEQGSGGEEDEEEEAKSLGELTDSLQAAEANQKKLEKEVEAFLSLLRDDGLAERFPSAVTQKLQGIGELSAETSSVLGACLGLLSRREAVRSLKLEQEVEKNRILSEALQTLATEHHQLEQSVVKGSSLPRGALSEDEFHDAVSESDSEISLSGFETVASHSCGEEEEEEEEEEEVEDHDHHEGSATSFSTASMSREDRHGDVNETPPNGIPEHRTSLPAPMFSRNDFSIWSILRNCIGMELSKITMPVIFNEPLSFLQRLTEYMEHVHLVHRANGCSDSIERMKCVAAFAVSAVASQWERTGKPFNPLLGETYELVREDLGFRLLSEQVSHHPPVSAFHAEGLERDFVFHGSIYPKLKFWGKSVEAEPRGVITLELPRYNEAYTWTNPTCCVHNIIVGQLWIEQYGNVEVVNHRTGERCCLNFKPCGLFGKELHKVEGYILDKSKKKLCALYGKWTECLYAVEPAAFEAHNRTSDWKRSGRAGSEDQEEVPSPAGDTVEMVPGSRLLWRIAPRPANSTEMYSFTSFAMQLNELRVEMEGALPHTDCRRRPDIRAMENGDIDLAGEEKKRLEDKQRAGRKNRCRLDEEWETRWFQQGQNPHTSTQDWIFSSGYWDRKYSQLPDIY